MNSYNQSVLLRYLVMLIILISGCKSKNIYDHAIPINDFHWLNAKRDTCNNIRYVNYLVKVYHESLQEKELSNYTLVMLFEDVVYNGKFDQQITLRDIPICMNAGANMISIKFAIVDSLNNQVYIWQNEDSYPLDKYSKMTVTLRRKQKFNIDDGDFRIKLR